MLLSSVSYKIAVSRLLPTVSYLTSLDKYCICSLVMIVLMLAYHAVIGLVIGSFDVHILRYFDRLFFMGFIAGILFMQLRYVKWLLKISDHRDNLIAKSIFYEEESKNNNKKNN